MREWLEREIEITKLELKAADVGSTAFEYLRGYRDALERALENC